MTAGERAIWAAVFAASWHQSTGGLVGAVGDYDRARWCAYQASRALEALQAAASEPGTSPSLREAIEVLR